MEAMTLITKAKSPRSMVRHANASSSDTKNEASNTSLVNVWLSSAPR